MAKLETGVNLSVSLRVPEDLFLIRESAMLVANIGTSKEILTVDGSETTPDEVIVNGTVGQIAMFEEILTDAARASVKVNEATGTSRAAYEAGMRDHFQLQAVRRGLRRAA